MNLKNTSKRMSLILRHKPAEFGVLLDAEGWTTVEELLAGLRTQWPDTSREHIDAVVAEVEADKQRFSIHEDHIRANYGHSLDERIEQEAATPPDLLLHGTPGHFVDAILAEGLKPMSRQYVHLTPSLDIATRVGQRRGKPVLLEIDAARAHQDGVVFYRANDSFWLVDEMPASYLRRV
jgi:putative RNA 2'-phosphotransferase